MRVIGIDPGTAIVGYGIIDYDKNKYSIVDYGVVLTSKDLSTEERLEIVYNEIDKIFEKFVAMSELCEKYGIDEDEIRNFIVSEQDKIYNGVNDLYIELSGEILSQNE